MLLESEKEMVLANIYTDRSSLCLYLSLSLLFDSTTVILVLDLILYIKNLKIWS